MGIFKGIVDFALFKEFVTPGIIKLVYLIIFIIMNVTGIAGIAASAILPAISIAGVLKSNGLYGILAAVLFAVFVLAAGAVMLVFYNLFLRMYFELALILFNIHGYLKSIDEKTVKK